MERAANDDCKSADEKKKRMLSNEMREPTRRMFISEITGNFIVNVNCLTIHRVIVSIHVFFIYSSRRTITKSQVNTLSMHSACHRPQHGANG